MHAWRCNLAVCLLAASLAGCVKAPHSGLDMLDENAVAAEDEGDEGYALAIAALENNDVERALVILNELTQQRPDSVGVWLNLGLAHFKQHDMDGAEAAADTALRLDAEVAEGLNLKGLIEYQRGNVAAARDYYQAALRQNRNYGLAHYNLALVYDVYFHDIAKALEHYRRYLALDGHSDEETMIWVEELEAVERQ